MTLPLVPGGPDPSTNGFSNFMPLTVIDRSVTSPPRGPTGFSRKRMGYHGPRVAFNPYVFRGTMTLDEMSGARRPPLGSTLLGPQRRRAAHARSDDPRGRYADAGPERVEARRHAGPDDLRH